MERLIKRRTFLEMIAVGGLSLLAATIPDSPQPKFILPSEDRYRVFYQHDIEQGYATADDVKQRKRIIEESMKLYREFINPRLIRGLREIVAEQVFSLRDIHYLRSVDLLEKGSYAVPTQIRLYDTSPKLFGTMGTTILLVFDGFEQISSFKLGISRGGLYAIDEIASRGEVRPNRLFPSNFDFVPVEKRIEVARSLLNLPDDIRWRHEPSSYRDEGFDLIGDVIFPGNKKGELSFDSIYGFLPRLKVNIR